MREELHRILGEARAARTIPWDANRTALYRAIFPQMTECLPEDEGAQLRLISKPKWPGWKQHNLAFAGHDERAGLSVPIPFCNPIREVKLLLGLQLKSASGARAVMPGRRDQVAF